MERDRDFTELNEFTAPPLHNDHVPSGHDPSQDGWLARHMADLRQSLSGSKVNVLLSCSLLQLPTWGFAMTYGIFQEYFLEHWTFKGSQDTVGIIGMTFNGVVYLSMPILFAIFTRHYARYRKIAAIFGATISCISFMVCSFSRDVWHLVLAQGILAPFGTALVYTTTTLSLGEHYSTENRAIAYGITLSCKNITGTVCPFLMQALLDRFEFANAVRIWAAIFAATAVPAVLWMPYHPPGISSSMLHGPRKIPWDFLHHRTFWVYSVGIMLQSSGYGIPQTYLNGYAHSVASLSVTSSTLMITLFNVPGILSSSFFGYLADNKRMPLSASATAAISALSSGLAAFLFWGLAGSRKDSLALLVLFSIVYGFFAGGYSATWGGMIKELESEAAEKNEAIDSGMVYGLLNGARGIGFVSGGVAGVQLLNVGGDALHARFGYGTKYGPMILYTGLATALGGWSLAFKWRRLLCWA